MASTLSLSSSEYIPGDPLPDYVVMNLTAKESPPILRMTAAKLSFPLAPEDLSHIKILEAKFDGEKNCAGLAGPQIGIAKQIIVFAAPENPELQKWRADFTQFMDKTIWINPSYEGLGEEKTPDYEACFSVSEMAGLVSRYKRIRYQAYTIAGTLVEGIAEGFLARIIQHESDHVNGKLFIDYVPEDQLIRIDEYRKKRNEALKTQE